MLIARDMARAADPVLFAKDCGFDLDPWQQDFVRSSARRVLQLAARQVGKTTSTAIKTFHTAVYEPGALIVVVAPAERQSKEFIRSVRHMHRALEGAMPLASESVTKVEFQNESRILALPGGEEGRTIRGLAGARLIVVDEAAQVSDELLAAIRPMMATNPRAEMIALTTPKGRRGWFYDAWHDPDSSWQRVRVTVDMCPRITAAFLADERKALGPTRFAEEYELAFIDSDTAAFSTALIDAAFKKELRPLWS